MLPAHIPTDVTKAEVSALVSFGTNQEDIAKYIGISVDTLQNKYRYQLDTALTHANKLVAKSLFKKATEDEDVKAQMFWLKTRGRWREKDAEDHSAVNNLLEKIVDKLVE